MKLGLIYLLKKFVFYGTSIGVGSVILRKLAYRMFLRPSVYKNGMMKFFINERGKKKLSNSNKTENQEKMLEIYLIPGKINFSINQMKYAQENKDNQIEKPCFEMNLFALNAEGNNRKKKIINVNTELEKLNIYLKKEKILKSVQIFLLNIGELSTPNLWRC